MTRFWTIRGRRRHRHWMKQLWRDIDPESAEGKAIARLEAMERGDPVEWITEVEAGSVTEADIEESLKRLEQRYGYSLRG